MVKAIDREMKRGTLEMILLKLLEKQQMYGYEIGSTLEKSSGEAFQLKEGTLYPVLYRLENAGLIEARWETQEGSAERRGTPRKYYRLTERGAEQLRRLIADWQDFSAAVNRLLEMENFK
jgi:PadR family transcriptional regulator PadR